MRLDDFDYHLPDSSIAQEPAARRSQSRLMVVHRGTGTREHRRFFELPELLRRGDLLVVNRSRVIPARIFLSRATGGRVEVLYLESRGEREVLAWVRPLARLRPGERLSGPGEAAFEFVRKAGEREGVLRFEGGDVDSYFEEHGHMPLPPYIHREDTAADRARYQTVFAREAGSVAAPTAGLHFDDGLFDALRDRGVEVASVVLHVGPGTFSPLERNTVEDNQLHAERYHVSEELIERVVSTRDAGGRVIAVGTTAARTLESLARDGAFDAAPAGRSGSTNLFIYPGYNFGVVDAMITNFHLPRSSLLMLVSAFAGRELVLDCYREAVADGYRFYSYGDAMLIL